MEDNKTLWNKKADELTVGDSVKLSVSMLAVTYGTIIAGTVAISAGAQLWHKFQEKKAARKLQPVK